MKSGGYLKRHGPLKRRAALLRTAMLPLINKARAAKRRANDFGPQAQRCRELPCCSCLAAAPSDPAHILTRASLRGQPPSVVDRANVVPLCRECHILQGTIGILTFQVRFSFDLQEVADRIAAQLEAEGVIW